MRLPPLDALRAFDAAYTHGSFTRAGDALHLTHGAVSRQVARLERDLGLALFRRVARGLEPTSAGSRFQQVVARSLAELGLAAAALREEARGGLRGTVRVSVLPSFGVRWLLPRLPGFHAAHPNLDVDLVADNLSPGPDHASVLGRMIAYGRWIGFLSSWGVCTGALVHVLAAALGLPRSSRRPRPASWP